jgi:hypothetical protein
VLQQVLFICKNGRLLNFSQSEYIVWPLVQRKSHPSEWPESDKPLKSGCGRGSLGGLGFWLRLGCDRLPLDVFLAALALYRFVVLLAHKGSLLCQSVTFV